ncbi:MAG TPA: glutaminyl-peptide cyclotransferase [Anaerolineae bacterium]
MRKNSLFRLRLGELSLLCLVVLTVACSSVVNTAAPDAVAIATATTAPTATVVPTTTATHTPAATATPVPNCASLSDGLATPTPPADIPVYGYRITHIYPHDSDAFTQGLVYDDGVLYEGTGRNGESTLRRVDLETGEVLQLRELPAAYFGEGIALYDNEIVQLTWQSNVGFVYNRSTFEVLRQFTYATEGWGLTHNGRCLIMSDGTDIIYFRDPETFAEIGRLHVYDNNGPVTQLNELEYVQGEIYANVWQTDRIARILPDTGQVIGWIDLTGLLEQVAVTAPVDVLNGIAYDAQGHRLFVTGKLWPALFEIELVPQE